MNNIDDHSMDDFDPIDLETEESAQATEDRAVWIIVGIVSCVIFGVLLGVMNHAIEKPTSPQALVAAAFNLPTGTVKEWKPGMGAQPFMFHPAGFQAAVKNWKPLYLCPTHGSTVAPVYDGNGTPHCPTCNQLMVANK